MDVGDLTADQQRFVAGVASGAGLSRAVVTGWVGCESGWNRDKGDHNYLNIGPGRIYRTTGEAVSATVALIKQMGIRGANGREQVASIKASPWDAGHYAGGCLDSVTATLLGGVAGTGTSSFWGEGVLGDIGGAVTDFAEDPLGTAVGELVDVDGLVKGLLAVALGAVFTIAAFGLIILGVGRVTNGRVSVTSLRNNLQAAGTTAALAAAV